MHKWQSHARRHLLFDIGLYALLMALFISDLSIIGLTMGRSFLSPDALARFGGEVPTARSVLDRSPYGLASTVQELCIACICVRNLWCGSRMTSSAVPWHALATQRCTAKGGGTVATTRPRRRRS
jgi:hypothetical protein